MSEHATEILGFELSRRLRSRQSSVESIVAHPGGAIDALTADRPGIHTRPAIVRAAARILGRAFSSIGQGKDSAAEPAVAAIAARTLPPGEFYIGPRRGAPGPPTIAEPVDIAMALATRAMARNNPHLYDMMFGLSTSGTYRATPPPTPPQNHFREAYGVLVRACERMKSAEESAPFPRSRLRPNCGAWYTDSYRSKQPDTSTYTKTL